MLLCPSARRKFRLRQSDAAAMVMAFFLLSATLLTPVRAAAEDGPGKPAAIDFSLSFFDAGWRSKISGKPIVLVFTAEWCLTCRKMRSDIFKDQALIKTAQGFEWLLIDIDRQPSLARAYEVEKIPQLNVIDNLGRQWAVISGLSDAATLQNNLTQILAHIQATGKDKSTSAPMRFEGESSVPIFGLKDVYLAQSICYANVGYGPLKLPSQSPLQGLRLGFTPRTPSTLIEGEKELQAQVTWVNIWADEAAFKFDYETLQTVVSLGYGLTDTLQIEGGVSVQSRFGGAMDSFIQEFHDLFGIDQNGRDQVPKGDFGFDIYPDAAQPGVSLSSDDRGIYTTAVELTLQHNVTCGTLILPAFSYGFTVRCELESDDLEGGSPFDFGVSVALAKRYDQVHFYGTLGWTKFGREQFRGLELRNSQLSCLAGLEWRAFATASVLIQYLFTEGLADSPQALSEPSHEITLGAKWEFANGSVLEFGLIENIITFGNSPDFGLHLGLTTRF